MHTNHQGMLCCGLQEGVVLASVESELGNAQQEHRVSPEGQMTGSAAWQASKRLRSY
jgi:hypothetical protein